MPVQSRNAKYIDLAQQLRADVKSGRLKPGQRLPSFVEMRNEHSISRGTVEKIHTVLEREGLIVREQGRGVFVAPKKRVVATGIIGFLGGGFSEATQSMFWSHLMDGMRQGAAREKMQLLLMTETSDPEVWSKIDGLLMSVNEENIPETLKLLPNGLPCVSILTATEEMSSVMVDDYQGARDATDHLLSLGHKRIGHLVAGYNHLVEHRLDGYRDALNRAGIQPSLLDVRQMHPRLNQDSKKEFVEQGRISVREWLANNWHKSGYTALLVQNDNAAVGAIEAFQEAGLRVPEDVSVVGFDGNEMYDYFTPRLTTVEVPVQEIGATAVRMLLEQVETRSEDVQKITLPTRLQVGGSTAPPKF